MNISIDPGKTHAGVAIWEHNRLFRAFYAPNLELDSWIDVYGPFGELHLERQYLTKGHPRPMDIVELAHGAGWARGVVQALGVLRVIEHLPIRWKGNVPKPIMTKRILAKLDPSELASIEKAGYKDHNTIDAIGIGLFALGRL